MQTKPVVLVVDDDRNTRDGLQRALARDYQVVLAEDGEKALATLEDHRVDVMLSDLRMPGLDGMTLVRRAMGRQPGLQCVLLTAYGNVETAVEAMKAGAYDFLMKPVNLDHLELVLKRAIRSRTVESENAKLKAQLDDKYGLENIIGSSQPMKQVFEVIQQAAPTQATILVQGESGTGKELVAHAIHRLSSRSRGPFIPVHCSALSPTLLESELFGHEKGAFTGAVARRRGRFEMADGGTLFLDEVSEVDLSIQVKLLRVLEERRFERVGGNETVEVDIRLIAATNRDLRQLVDEKRFREDLFFRLNVVDISLPPLRRRRDDIPVLCDHFLREFAQKNNRTVEGFTADAVQLLTAYEWPGNVRELRNTIEKMVVLSRGPRLSARDVPVPVRSATRPAGGPAGGSPLAGAGAESLADLERKRILLALENNGGNVTRAARELGISRRTLHRKINQYRAEGVLVATSEEDAHAAPAEP